jgi:hypothetical protein
MLETYPRDTAHDKIWEALDRDGAVIVRDFAPPDVAERLASDFAPHIDAAPWCNADAGDQLGESFFGLRTKRFHGLLGLSAAFGEVIVDPLLLAMCDHFLKPRCRDYRVSTSELMVLGRGETDQDLHRDADSWRFFPEPRPEILVSANVALTDFTETNGATVVVAGSHKWPRGRKPTPDERAQAVMPRGSALLYSGNVLHGGGANQTDEIRIGMYVGYVLSWLRPLENHLITNGEAAIQAAPDRAQLLLDYTETGWSVFP